MKVITHIRYGGPEVLESHQVERPLPQTDELLIKIVATTVTAVDVIFRRGTDPFARLATGLFAPKKGVLGSDFSGEVVAIGAGVSRFRVGQPVFGASDEKFGAHAEYLCLKEAEAFIAKPDAMTHQESAALPYGGLTALHFLRDIATVKRGDVVLVIGAAGGVGSYATQLAKHFGARVTAFCRGEHASLVRSLGADEVIDRTRHDFAHEERKYDLIFDTVGKSSFAASKRALKERGLYLTTRLNGTILMTMLRRPLGGGKKGKIAFAGLRKPEEKRSDLLFLTDLVAAGDVRPVIARRYPLAQIAQAHRYVEQGSKTGGVVVDV